MTIQKKSLIGSLTAAKKAIIATSVSSSPVSAKPLAKNFAKPVAKNFAKPVAKNFAKPVAKNFAKGKI